MISASTLPDRSEVNRASPNREYQNWIGYLVKKIKKRKIKLRAVDPKTQTIKSQIKA